MPPVSSALVSYAPPQKPRREMVCLGAKAPSSDRRILGADRSELGQHCLQTSGRIDLT